MDQATAKQIRDEFNSMSAQEQDSFIGSLSEKEKDDLITDIENTPADQPYDLGDSIPQGAGSKNYPVEENPDIEYWKSRFPVKNLGNSSAIVGLREQYPDLQIEQNDKGRYIYQRKEGPDKQWYTMDPDKGLLDTTFSDPMEHLRDVGDVLSDVGAGIAETGGQVAGSMAGALSGFGLGGVPGGVVGGIGGGMAGGAVAGGAAEAARQGLGKMLGVNQEVDWKDVLRNGQFAGLFSLLGGNKSKKAMEGLGLRGAANPEAIMRPFKTAADYVGDYARTLGGAPRPEIQQQGRKYLPRIMELENKYDSVIPQESKQMKRDAQKIFSRMEKETGEEIGNRMAGAEGVDISKAQMRILERIDELSKRHDTHGLFPGEEEEKRALEKVYVQYFTKAKELTPEEKEFSKALGINYEGRFPIGFDEPVSAADAIRIKRDLGSSVQWGKTKLNMTDLEKRQRAESVAVYADINEAINEAVLKADERGMKGINAKYKNIQEQRKVLEQNGVLEKGVGNYEDMMGHPDLEDVNAVVSGNDKKAMQSFTTAKSKPDLKATLNGMDNYAKKFNLPGDLEERANTLEASKTWMNPDKADYKDFGTKKMGGLLRSTLIPTAAAAMGYNANQDPTTIAILAGLTGMSGFANSPWMLRKYFNAKQGVRSFSDKLGYLPDATKRALLHEMSPSNPWDLNNEGGQ